MPKSIIVAGVDVGGSRKGFHAVALRDGTYWQQSASCDPADIASWCGEVGASFIAIDAPCRWSITGRARPAERELMAKKIWCFSTPSRKVAETHPKDYFRWMLNGAELFKHLESNHTLFTGNSRRMMRPVCFETFPQAVACALAGAIVSAKQKRSVRRDLLNRAGVDTSNLKTIDEIDAALCALAAHFFALGTFKTYGEPETGLIIVPNR